jgi:hypothetical protein
MAFEQEQRPKSAAEMRIMLREANKTVVIIKSRQWRAIGKSVQGASHKQAGLPNQDAVHWLPESGKGLPLIMAVSDGDGRTRGFRSSEGARLAVQEAASSLQDFIGKWPDLSNLSIIKQVAEEQLPKMLARGWEQAVNNHIKKKPFSRGHLEALEKRAGVSERHAVEKNNLLAYSATLLAVLATDLFIIYLQLGDGDLLTVSESGEVSRAISKEKPLSADKSPLLCSPNSWRDFRVRFQVISGLPPALILLSTGSYADSFRNEEEFLKAGSDLLKDIRSDGIDKVNSNLETQLSESARAGKGEDVTLGIIYRLSSK